MRRIGTHTLEGTIDPSHDVTGYPIERPFLTTLALDATHFVVLPVGIGDVTETQRASLLAEIGADTKTSAVTPTSEKGK